MHTKTSNGESSLVYDLEDYIPFSLGNLTFRDVTDGSAEGYEALQEYLHRAMSRFDDDHYVLEIGCRDGGSALLSMLALLEENKKRVLVTVDPYNEVPYIPKNYKYGYKHQKTSAFLWADIQKNIFDSTEKEIHHQHYYMTDKNFFDFADEGIPYSDRVCSWCCFAFLDGPHGFNEVNEELGFLSSRMQRGAYVLIDNYDMETMKYDLLLSDNEDIFREVCKISTVAVWEKL